MYLYINTSKKETSVSLLGESLDIVGEALKDGEKNQSENLLKLIDEVFKKKKLKKSEIWGIFVVEGPGSYTGLRVGIATANALAHALSINVLGVKKTPNIKDVEKLKISNKIVTPKYSYPPKITKERSRL